MYFDTHVYQAPYCFSGFFKIVGSRAHFNTMCFSFAAKTMAADANQLQDLREFLLAGDEENKELRFEEVKSKDKFSGLSIYGNNELRTFHIYFK